MTEKHLANSIRKLDASTRARSRTFRRDMTDTERALWNCLRNRAFENWKFVRQHPIGPYFADFVCRKAKLVVELDGTGHDQTIDHDERRDTYLKALGYRVLRIPSVAMMKNADGVVAAIRQALSDQ